VEGELELERGRRRRVARGLGQWKEEGKLAVAYVYRATTRVGTNLQASHL
jgi:hypothetical protein